MVKPASTILIFDLVVFCPPYSDPAHYAAIVSSNDLLYLIGRRGADMTALNHRSRTPLPYSGEYLNRDAINT